MVSLRASQQVDHATSKHQAHAAANEDADLTALLGAHVLALDGSNVRIGALTTRGPVLLVFVRHFGCLFCKEQVGEVLTRRADFEARGVEPIIVGNGSVEDARAFAREHAAGLRVLTDPHREAYCAAGMKRGASTSMGFGVMRRATRAMMNGYRQTKTQGDPFQQGGVIGFGTDGRVRYRFISEEAGEHPALNDVLRAFD
jgi:peroxiredoxin